MLSTDEALPDCMTVEWEAVPLGSGLGAATMQLLASSSLAGAGPLVSADTDKTGLFAWRGARCFVAALREAMPELLRQRQAGSGDQQSGEAATIGSSSMGVGGGSAEGTGCTNPVGVVELGAGVGIGATAMACAFPNVTAIATDFWPPVLEMAQQMAARNAGTMTAHGSRVTTEALDWCWFNESATASDGGSECPHSEAATNALQSIRRALSETRGASTNADGLPSTSGAKASSTNAVLPLILALDTVYPDTRGAVLLGLVRCLHRLMGVLAEGTKARDAACQHHGEEEEQCTSSEVPPLALMAFVERDAGLTLRRLIVAMAAGGLDLVPLSSPFESSAGANGGLATLVACRDATATLPFAGLTAHERQRLWSRFEASVLAAVAVDGAVAEAAVNAEGASPTLLRLHERLGRIVCGNGDWLFAVVPQQGRPVDHPVPPALSADADGTTFEAMWARIGPQAMYEGGAVDGPSPSLLPQWVALLPWLFPPAVSGSEESPQPDPALESPYQRALRTFVANAPLFANGPPRPVVLAPADGRVAHHFQGAGAEDGGMMLGMMMDSDEDH